MNERCLVLNAPWCDSFKDTAVRRGGEEIFIESESLQCKIVRKKIVNIETVYLVDEDVEFMEITPSPPLQDFYLAKERLLCTILGIKHSSSSECLEKVVFLRKRELSKFVFSTMSPVCKSVMCYFIVKIPKQIMFCVANLHRKVGKVPVAMGIFKMIIETFHYIQKDFIMCNHPIMFVRSLCFLPTRVYMATLSSLYTTIAVCFMEAVHLVCGKSYNPLKERMDTVSLTTDQLFMLVLLSYFCVLTITSMFWFYVFFIFMNIGSAVFEFIGNFLDFILIDTSQCSTYHLCYEEQEKIFPKIKYGKVSTWEKMKLAVVASFYTSGMRKSSEFVARLFLGRKWISF